MGRVIEGFSKINFAAMWDWQYFEENREEEMRPGKKLPQSRVGLDIVVAYERNGYILHNLEITKRLTG